MCVVGGKALKPDKMQTDTDDEPKAGALGADRVLREKKHPMEKWLEDAESRLNTQQTTRMGDMAAMAARYETPQPNEKTPPQKKRVMETDTDASTKKKLASLEKQMATLKKQLAKR